MVAELIQPQQLRAITMQVNCWLWWICMVAGSIKSECAFCVCKNIAVNAGYGLSISLSPGEDAEKLSVPDQGEKSGR